MNEELLIEVNNLKNRFNPSQNEGEEELLNAPKSQFSEERGTSLLFPIFIELVHLVKSTFSSFHNLCLLSQGKFSDREFGDYFSRTVMEDTKKIDLLLDGVLDYIELQTPFRKRNTVHTFIEELLKKDQVQLEGKNIRLFKKFEKGLPETAVPENQLRYILNTILRYAVTVIPVNGSIGVLTKSSMLQGGVPAEQVLFERDDNYVEILIQFTARGVQTEESHPPQIQINRKKKLMNFESVLDLEFRLVEEVVKRNRGAFRLETDEKKSKTSVFLRFPVERRRG